MSLKKKVRKRREDKIGVRINEHWGECQEKNRM